jgi:hypothetical protein
MSIRTKLKSLLSNMTKAIAPEPEQLPTSVEQVRREIRENEEARLSSKERAIAKARDRACKRAKELGYTEDEFDHMISSRSIVVGQSPLWLAEYLDELIQISQYYTLSAAQELDKDFQAAGCRSIVRPSRRQRW